MERAAAIDRVEAMVETVESEPMPVPVREVWLYGDAALGLDPVERLDVYLTKDLHMRGDTERGQELSERYGVAGIGSAVSAEWAAEHPQHLRANDAGYAAPARCLAAHLVRDDEPIHLEVCNASFDQNVTRRLQVAVDREAYEQVLDPRGVQLWADGEWATETLNALREGAVPFPTLERAFGMLDVDAETAGTLADAVEQQRAASEGPSVRGDVV